ncbi:hypothetical protein KP509_22G049400 [Ceratopteris richardii]|uniref:Uncharacterized protein n=1 Tax=Ceratopteris richardii TaxID=49495 RepID=A0A8T2S6V7_CERRI|nr:hypothetical protein KP509_22G049400 [Ceratopteris richardii]
MLAWKEGNEASLEVSVQQQVISGALARCGSVTSQDNGRNL